MNIPEVPTDNLSPHDALCQDVDAYYRALQSAQSLLEALPESAPAEMGRRAAQAVDMAEDSLHAALGQLAAAGLGAPVPPLPLTEHRLIRRIEVRRESIRNMMSVHANPRDACPSASPTQSQTLDVEEDALYEDLCLLSAMTGSAPPVKPEQTPARLRRRIALLRDEAWGTS